MRDIRTEHFYFDAATRTLHVLPEYHEMLQATPAQNRSVTCATDARSSLVFRCKRFLRRRFLRDVIADHRVETAKT